MFAFLAFFAFALGCGKTDNRTIEGKNDKGSNENSKEEFKEKDKSQTKPKEENNMDNSGVYKTVIIKTEGMSCSHCENSIKTSVSKLDGVKEVIADAKTNTAKVTFDESKTNIKAIQNAITEAGYGVLEPAQ